MHDLSDRNVLYSYTSYTSSLTFSITKYWPFFVHAADHERGSAEATKYNIADLALCITAVLRTTTEPLAYLLARSLACSLAHRT